MSFIPANEHLLWMMMPVKYEEPDRFVPLDDKKAVFDAGIHTAYYCYLSWKDVQPAPGEYDWGRVDRQVKELRSVGYRVIVNCYCFPPDWLPDAWYCQKQSGIEKGALSLWNEDGLNECEAFYRKVKQHFGNEALVVNSFLMDGETAYLNEPAWYDAAALADYKRVLGSSAEPEAGSIITDGWLTRSMINVLVRLQTILADNPYREIWTQLHPALAGYRVNGCDHIPEILTAYKAIPGGVNIKHLYYTWIMWNGLWPTMANFAKTFDEEMWGGAEYAEGLPVTTPAAISQGLKGQIIGLCHPFTGHERIEPFMLDNIRAALRLWPVV